MFSVNINRVTACKECIAVSTGQYFFRSNENLPVDRQTNDFLKIHM